MRTRTAKIIAECLEPRQFFAVAVPGTVDTTFGQGGLATSDTPTFGSASRHGCTARRQDSAWRLRRRHRSIHARWTTGHFLWKQGRDRSVGGQILRYYRRAAGQW